MNGEELAVPQPAVSSNCNTPLLPVMFVVVVSRYWNPALLLNRKVVLRLQYD